MLFFLISSASHGFEGRKFQMCIATDAIDFNPYQRIYGNKNNRFTYYSMLVMSYISEKPDVPGILSKWNFSPDGKRFLATVSDSAKWQDGTRVTAWEAALGIAKGLTFRALGEKVLVVGTEKINEPGWKHGSYKGIIVHNDYKFELIFESEVANLDQVLRHALSSHSRLNRLWPARLSKMGETGYLENQFDVVSKHKVYRDAHGIYSFHFHNYEIVLKTHKENLKFNGRTEECQGDFYVCYRWMPGDPANYVERTFQSPQTILGFMNGDRLNYEQREVMAKWLRALFERAPFENKSFETKVIGGHFDTYETGYTVGIDWGKKFPTSLPKSEFNILLWSENRIVSTVVESSAKKLGAKVHWFYEGKDRYDVNNLDFYLMFSVVDQGAQPWIESVAKNPFVKTLFYKNFPKTFSSLENIMVYSFVSIPSQHQELQRFERATFEEKSVIPIGRSYLRAFSLKSLPLELRHNGKDELFFSIKDRLK